MGYPMKERQTCRVDGRCMVRELRPLNVESLEGDASRASRGYSTGVRSLETGGVGS